MRKMSQPPNLRRTLIATLAVYSDTGESGETYDLDVQTLPLSRKDNLLTRNHPFRILNSWPDSSESGEAYEAEVEAYQRDNLSEEPIATTTPIHG